MAELTPDQVFSRYKNGELVKSVTIDYLRSIIENNENDKVRLEALELLGEIIMKSEETFKFFENLVVSDLNLAVRTVSLRIIIEHFFEEREKVLRWLFEHEKSVNFLLAIYNYLETAKLKTLIELMMKIVGRDFIQKYGISPNNAMALRFFELKFYEYYGSDFFITDEVRNNGSLYLSLDTGGHSCLDFLIEGNHIKSIIAREFPLDLSIVKFFNHLRKLYINVYSAGSQDLNGISELSNLEILELEFIISNIYEIGLLPKLKSLSLNEVRIDNLNFLRDLINLEELSISKIDDCELYNEIREIENLENLKKLKNLTLRGCSIEKINGLENLTNLEKLDLSYNKIIEFKGIENLNKLEYLDLSNNQITEINGLNNLTNLKTLSLYTIKIKVDKVIEFQEDIIKFLRDKFPNIQFN